MPFPSLHILGAHRGLSRSHAATIPVIRLITHIIASEPNLLLQSSNTITHRKHLCGPPLSKPGALQEGIVVFKPQLQHFVVVSLRESSSFGDYNDDNNDNDIVMMVCTQVGNKKNKLKRKKMLRPIRADVDVQ